MYNVAISFNGKDKREYAKKLANILEKKYNLSVWIDEIDKNLKYNFNSLEHLNYIFRKSQYIIVLYSKEYGNTFFTNFEKNNLFYGVKKLFIVVEKKFEKDIQNKYPQYIYENFNDAITVAQNFVEKFLPKFLKYKIQIEKEFNVEHLYNTKFSLNDIYIEQNFAVYSKNIKKFENFKHEQNRFLSNDTLNFQFLIYTKKTINKFLFDFFNYKNQELNKTNLILLFGHPGSGKSSLLKKIYIEDNDREIIFIRLRDIISVENQSNTFSINPIGIINDYLKSIEYFNNLSNKIVLLDGLDEYIMLSKETLSNLHNYTYHIINDLLSFAYRNDVLFIISTRFGYFDFNGIDEFLNSTKIYKNRLTIIKLKEFTSKQIFKFMKKMKLENNKIKNICQVIKKDYKTKELLQQPILLFLIITFNISFDNNLNRADIYQKIFDEIIKRKWDNSDFSVYISEILNKIGYENILELIASKLEFNKKLLLKESEIIELLDKYLDEKEYNFSTNELKELFSDILVAFYFKESQSNKEMALEFLHRSFQEFFSAKFLVKKFIENIENKNEKELIKFINNNFRYLISYDVKNFIKELYNPSNIDNLFLKKFFNKLLNNEFFINDKISNTIAKFYNTYWIFHLKNNISLIDKKQNSQNFTYYLNHFNIYIQNNSIDKENLFFENNIIDINNEKFIENEMANIFKKISFNNCYFDKVFLNGQIFDSYFNTCNFEYLNSAELTIKFTIFSDTIFNYVNLNTTIFQKCKFQKCKFIGSSFFQIDFIDCYFDDVEFDIYCSFDNTTLKNCRGNNVKISQEEREKIKFIDSII